MPLPCTPGPINQTTDTSVGVTSLQMLVRLHPEPSESCLQQVCTHPLSMDSRMLSTHGSYGAFVLILLSSPSAVVTRSWNAPLTDSNTVTALAPPSKGLAIPWSEMD